MKTPISTVDYLILTPSFFPTYNGMTFSALEHAIMLRELNNTVAVMSDCAPEDRVSAAKFCQSRGINHVPISIRGSGLPFRPLIGNIDEIIKTARSLQPKYVIIEGQHFWGYHIIPKLKKENLKIALISHGSADTRFRLSSTWLPKFIAYHFYDVFFGTRILKLLDAAAVLSAHRDNGRFKDITTFERVGLSPVILGNGTIDHQNNFAVSQAVNFPRFIAAVIGEMSENKNQLAALKILKKAPQITEIRFYYQTENQYSREVKSKAIKDNIFNAVHITGLDRTQIIESLHDVNLIICLSKTEAQPLSIIDGLSLGIPFLSTPVGCIPSLSGGITAKLNEMPRHIQFLAENRNELTKLSNEALSFFRAHHSKDVLRKKIGELLSL